MPTTKEMIIEAVGDLKDRKGASIIAIKKYLTDKYDDAMQHRMPMMTKLLRTAGTEGWLLQTAGTGASSGSRFKIPPKKPKMMKETADDMETQKEAKAKEKEAKAKEKEAKKKEKDTKAKQATKRKVEKKVAEKEVPAKKKKVAAEASKKKIATATKKNVA